MSTTAVKYISLGCQKNLLCVEEGAHWLLIAKRLPCATVYDVKAIWPNKSMWWAGMKTCWKHSSYSILACKHCFCGCVAMLSLTVCSKSSPAEDSTSCYTECFNVCLPSFSDQYSLNTLLLFSLCQNLCWYFSHLQNYGWSSFHACEWSREPRSVDVQCSCHSVPG